MKILICTGIYPPDIGGPATYSKLVSEELVKHGHHVNILTYGNSKIANDKLLITNVSRKLPTILRYVEYFFRVLDMGRDFDIIYVMDPVSVGFPATLANLILRKKIVLKVVGDYAWEQSQQITNDKLLITNLDSFYPFQEDRYPSKIRRFKKIQLWVARRVDKIVTPSFYLKNILINGWGIDDKKIEVIYNSFNVYSAVIASGVHSEANGVAWQSHNLKLLSVGRLVPWKGFVELANIVNNIEEVSLEIIGTGTEKDNIKTSDKVKLLGQLSHEDVVQKMCSANLFILNTSYEGLSHVVLEAMAVGLPVLISTAGGNKELVGENEERGYLFEYNNKVQIKEKIEYIKNHQEEVKEKAKKAQEFVSSFNKEKMIERLLDLFNSLN